MASACHKRSGIEASRRGKNWKIECRPDMIRVIENHRFQMFLLALEEQNRATAQAKRKFSLLSHTPANRTECPCCKHFWTTPANTSILPLSLKTQNFKFVTLTRAPSQPVALFFHALASASFHPPSRPFQKTMISCHQAALRWHPDKNPQEHTVAIQSSD